MAKIINGEEYAWADITVFMHGRPIIGIQGISYKTEQEKELIYGAGNEPLGIGRGNKKYEGEISLLQSEYEALIRAVGKDSDLTDFRGFDITVSYAPTIGGKRVTDQIKYAEFKETEKSWSQGDKHTVIKLPYLALRILYNI